MRVLRIGDVIDVDVVNIAHGGHCVAHHESETIFVRHAIPGERVRARITGRNARIVRADAVEILTPSQDRVEPPCAWAGPSACGGCDFQHVPLTVQRTWKSQILADALLRFGRLPAERIADLDTDVHALPGPPEAAEGLGWRSRVDYAQGPDGRWGLHRHRSADLVHMDRCLVAQSGADHPGPPQGARTVEVKGRTWRVTDDMFWQPHTALPDHLVDAVLAQGRPLAGEFWWDLYAGAGLLASFIGDAVGRAGQVEAVELSGPSMKSARRALHDLPQVRLHQADVAHWLSRTTDRPAGVVLDPPRKGAGRAVVEQLLRVSPERIVYVACDPMALARDTALLESGAYVLTGLHAVDAFPMSHHFETVALFTLGGSTRHP